MIRPGKDIALSGIGYSNRKGCKTISHKKCSQWTTSLELGHIVFQLGKLQELYTI
jgi:hypothetical protein